MGARSPATRYEQRETAVITVSDVAEVAATGDSISLDAYDGAPTSPKRADGIRIDTMPSIKWLQRRGYVGRMWRAAWTQNSAPQHAAAQPHALAYATPSSSAALARSIGGTSRGADPRSHRCSVRRDLRAARSDPPGARLLDAWNRREPDRMCTPAEWAYLVSRIEQGVDEGWLEGVTFEQLFTRSGGRFV